jgi:uncharacterized membrane protein
MMYGNNMSTGGWALSVLATLIILGLIVAVIVWFASRRPGRGGSRDGEVASAHEILDRRLASAEITTDQYDRLREKLDASPASSTP